MKVTSVVATPFGFTVPFNVVPLAVTPLAAPVVTAGATGPVSVV